MANRVVALFELLSSEITMRLHRMDPVPMSSLLTYSILALGVCLVCTSVGFKRAVYLVSLGYALSMAVQAIVFCAIYASTIPGWPLIQAVLLLLYAILLGGFLLFRSSRGGFQRELRRELTVGIRWSMRAKVGIWCGVSLLYLLLFLVTLLNLDGQAHGLTLWSAPFGVGVMTVGLLLEGTADRQKSHFKSRYPNRFCDVHLYRIVRHPNHLGEIVFWLGSWFASLAAYRTSLQWILCTLGFACMVAVMLDATRRLEVKQAARYGAENKYRVYASTVPVLFPVVPVYSLRNTYGEERPKMTSDDKSPVRCP